MRTFNPSILLALLAVTYWSQVVYSQSLRSPESIVWDEEGQRYLISNTVDGQLRTVDISGDIDLFGIDSKGSHGLLLQNGMLYACFRNEIRCYDTEGDRLVDTYEVPEAKFLNGICADDQGFLYITDFSERSIFQIEVEDDGGRPVSSQVWKEIDQIPNGIAYDAFRDELVVVTWGSSGLVHCYDRQTADLKHSLESGYANLESILIDDRGDAYVSAWSPSAILKFEQGVRSAPVVWRSEDVFRPTGMVLSDQNDLLFLSTDFGHIHGLSESGPRSTGPMLDAFPNPVSVNSLITYQVMEPGPVHISIYDSRGTLVQTLMTEEKQRGIHQFMYQREERANGLYFINIQNGSSNQAIAVTLVD
ncbi:MAG: T9SS type A sorting domain-containing protein [Flavobacteriales bacterium]|nr:T9SS type A sorting domain-containing protein [Flavobacteriales bacterium]